MASTKPTPVSYSDALAPMLDYLRNHLEGRSAGAQAAVGDALEVFFLNYPDDFVQAFLGELGIGRGAAVSSGPECPLDTDAFVDRLATLEGECVFLLRDAERVLKEFRASTGRGLGMVVNRAYLCRPHHEEDYFDLVGLVYRALSESDDAEGFLDRYAVRFAELVEANPHFRERSMGVAEYVAEHVGSGRITWVDFGFQYTFVLFCLASVSLHASGRIHQDFHCFTTYPWLHDRFRGHYFSAFTTDALALEVAGIQEFDADLRDRAAGALVGFAVGDALGFPVAGIEADEVARFAKVPIEGFERSPEHPFFSDREAGEVTSNTEMLVFSAGRLLRDGGFSPDAYAEGFASWGRERLDKGQDERWVGPTTREALRRLLAGDGPFQAGSTTSESCACLYRIVPLALRSPVALGPARAELRRQASQLASLTHNTPASRCGSEFLALLLSDLVVGVAPLSATKAALASLRRGNEDPCLLALLHEAMVCFSASSDDEARAKFGTGSPIRQSLPLSLFFFLKYQRDFRSGILAGANSYRRDTEPERERLARFAWSERLVMAKGGNTDGIAALVGCLLGATLGRSAIPEELRGVERSEALATLGERLVECVATP